LIIVVSQTASGEWLSHVQCAVERGCSNLVSGGFDSPDDSLDTHSLDTMDRIAMLNEILTENPKDAFARYGLAMEYSKQGDFDRALAEFSILLESHPEYTAGYFMAAQTLVKAERADDAKKMLNDGIASARRTGNLHAQSEMEAMLTELG
jgi:predicted Zn-dependent protease